jgi:predicted nucleic acid-binding protein
LRILFDTNVILDVLLNRLPHGPVASRLMVEVERGRLEGLLGATTITTIHYLATRVVGAARARKHVRTLVELFEIAPVDRNVLRNALDLGFKDFEDAVLHEAARQARASGIVTRDTVGFGRSTLSIYTPDELLRMVRALPEQ